MKRRVVGEAWAVRLLHNCLSEWVDEYDFPVLGRSSRGLWTRDHAECVKRRYRASGYIPRLVRVRFVEVSA